MSCLAIKVKGASSVWVGFGFKNIDSIKLVFDRFFSPAFIECFNGFCCISVFLVACNYNRILHSV